MYLWCFLLHSLAYTYLTTPKQKQLVIFIIVTAVCTLLYKIFIVNPQKSCMLSIQKKLSLINLRGWEMCLFHEYSQKQQQKTHIQRHKVVMMTKMITNEPSFFFIVRDERHPVASKDKCADWWHTIGNEMLIWHKTIR